MCRQYVLKHYSYWRLMLDKIETGQSHLGGPVEHSEGKCGRVLWLFQGFCVVALVCVGLGLMR
jgi:hypothetical protein